MKIAICDDDIEILHELRELIRRYAEEFLLDYEILEFDRCEALLQTAKKDGDIQIVFLDIYMSPMSGMELAEALRSAGNECAIIFVTTSTDHYAQSYEVKAEHYLVKPITYDRVSQAMSRCEQILEAAAKCALFPTGGREIAVPLRQIRFVEVFRNRSIVHALSDISVRCTLETVSRRISDRRFFKTHRSFLVNMEYIAGRKENDIILKTGERVPLSRTYEKPFEREYGRFLTASMTGESYEKR